MHFSRPQLIAAALLILAMAAGYLVNSIVPIFIASVLGLPVAAYLLNRAPN
ncbi:MAG: hypothetical protein M3Y34_04210 [Actinomycetota bacterium]|nr:hypothetical protein [Actinomycetota bacterium]